MDSEFEKAVREELAPKVEASAGSVIVVPARPDAKCALELGYCVYMDKPILLVVPPGRDVPAKLAAVADMVVYGDITDPNDRGVVEQAIRDFVEELRSKP